MADLEVPESISSFKEFSWELHSQDDVAVTPRNKES